MRFIIFGLTVSSSWGNGHATLWRSLIRAMTRRGHTVTFYEKDVPYYAGARDLDRLPNGGTLRLFSQISEINGEVKRALDEADIAICTSFCPDGRDVCELILDSRAGAKIFYDLDTPVTLDALNSGAQVEYLPDHGLRDFDLVLSYTGGRALSELQEVLGAKRVAPLYGSVDPDVHQPVDPVDSLRSSLSYLGTYAEDRQEALKRLFLEPASEMPEELFLIGGALYPETFPWRINVGFMRHVPPHSHPAFFSSGRATLNITRTAMARYGFCPSGRLFEAAACGAPLLTDQWEGLEMFFSNGSEALYVSSTADVIAALSLSDHELRRMAKAARDRTLAEYTGDCRVRELETICDSVLRTYA